tara:strand:+ start:213 stop:860 length:648 start_codon:yes stop_codon:yes gene_type:complete
MKYHIGSIGFKTKKAATDYTRTQVKLLGVCIIKKDNLAYEFFENLIQNHSEKYEKIGVGVDYFEIRTHSVYKNLSMLLHRIDGSNIDFSWVHCCEFKPRLPITNFKSALRMAIFPQTLEFKQNNNLICNICNANDLEWSQYEVDHIKPFSLLMPEFISIMTYPMPEIFDDCPVKNNAIFRIEDTPLKEEWINYHLQYANLQILCTTCNRTKSNKY